MDINSVTIVGRIGKDPELREIANSDDKLTSVAVANSSFKKVGDEWQEETSWFDVTFFGKTAERVVEKCQKGTLIAVQGNLKQRTWEDKNGNKRERVSIVGRQVQFLDKYKKRDKDAPVEEPPKRSDVPF